MNPQQFYGGQMDAGGYQPTAKKSIFTRRNILVIVAVVLVLLASLAGVYSATAKDPADELMGYAIKGDAQKSYALFSKRAQGMYGDKAWGAEVSTLSNLYSAYALDTKQTEEVDGTSVTTYRYTLTPKNAESKTIAWTIITLEDPAEGPTEITDYQYQSLKQ
jgi:hypothetical protein